MLALQAAYWRTRALVSSVDGVNAELPHLGTAQQQQRRSDAQALRLHYDQNPFFHGDGRDAIQGVLSLTPTTADGGGTTVVAGSHRAAVADALFPRCGGGIFGHKLRREAAWRKHVFYPLSPDETRRLLRMPGCALVHLATAAGDVVLFSSLAVHCGRRARGCTDDHAAWRFALYATCAPADRLTPEDRARKRCVLGLEPWPDSGARVAETTNHPPDGATRKPRYGDGARRPPAGVRAGIVTPPAWVLRDPCVLRLAGAQPYPDDADDDASLAPAASSSALLATPAARLGGAKRVAEKDVEGQRARRLARLAPPEVIVIDD